MKELFQKALVVCTAASAFFGGAYTLGSSVSSAFSNAIRSEITAYDRAVQAGDSVAASPGSSAGVVPSPKAKSKFGFTYEN